MSSFGHYLLSLAHEAERQTDRVRRAHDAAAQLPVLAGGVAGTTLPLRRASYTDRLAVPVELTTTRDAMWATDNLIEVMVSGCQIVTTASRFAEDLLAFCAPAFGYVRLHDAHCRAAVHLPQKRNPYALTVLRGGASMTIGRTTGVLTTVRTPTAQSGNWMHTYGEVLGTIEHAAVLVALAAEVVEHMQVCTDNLGAHALAGFTDATDVAEQLAGLSVVVDLQAQRFEEAAGQVVGQPVDLDAADRQSVDEVRVGCGLETGTRGVELGFEIHPLDPERRGAR